MYYGIIIYFYLFVFFSFWGWVLEFTFRSWKNKRMVNPGFLGGPYLPIYGTTAVLLAVTSSLLSNSSFVLKLISYFIITTGTEFCTGFFFNEFFKIRLWDYSKEHFTLKNHICLTFSIYWLILAFVFEYYLLPNAISLYYITPYFFHITVGVSCIMFTNSVLRFFYVLISKRQDQGRIDDDTWQVFTQIIEPLLKEPKVADLSNFRHHRMISRLDHSMEVAWLSYVIARRISVDYEATTRGALLHDLFFYEWLTDGPRMHGFRHPRICLENARQLTSLSHKEEDIILKHMWPLTFLPPRYSESWIVCLVDTYCTINDYLTLYRVWQSPDRLQASGR
jgi:uncharacterized protein